MSAWTTRTLLALAALTGPALSGCAAKQLVEQPRMENDIQAIMEQLDTLPPFPAPAPASGSLWTPAGAGAGLVRDLRAFSPNDLIMIELDERSVGTNESQTDLSRSSETDFGAGVAFGLEKANPQPGKFSLNNVLNTSAGSDFSGDGSTTRGNTLQGSITARVLRVLPNQDLVLAGQKMVMVNRERQMLTVVGTVRAADVSSDNRVPSTRVGDLTVRLWGRGEVDATVRQGWFLRVMNRVWPF